MKQSRWMSLVEAVTNVLVGYGVAVATQWAVFPLFGLHATLQENLVIGLVFTAVSLVRSYVLRRARCVFVSCPGTPDKDHRC